MSKVSWEWQAYEDHLDPPEMQDSQVKAEGKKMPPVRQRAELFQAIELHIPFGDVACLPTGHSSVPDLQLGHGDEMCDSWMLGPLQCVDYIHIYGC